MARPDRSRWKGKSRGGVWGYLFFIRTIRFLGIRTAYTFLLLVVPYFVPFAPRSTAAIWYYNRQRLGYGRLKAALRIFAHYYCFGQIIIDKIAIDHGMSGRYAFEFDNYDEFLAVLDSGAGVVLISAHVGNWAIGAPFFEDYGRKMNVVMYDAEYQKIKEALERNSSARDYRIIPVTDDSLDSILAIKRALDDREYVCFQGDRFVNPKNVVEADFMGGRARFPSGPFVVATRMQARVVFYFAMRERGRKYRFHFVMADEAAKDGGKPEEQLLRQYTGALAGIVGKYPRQWFNFYRFWN